MKRFRHPRHLKSDKRAVKAFHAEQARRERLEARTRLQGLVRKVPGEAFRDRDREDGTFDDEDR